MKVFVNGCFDLLTVGHFNLLTFARHVADNHGRGEVIVAIDEDYKIQASKGLRRPIFDVHERAKALLDLRIGDRQLVDKIWFFHTDHELLNLIKRERPNYLIKGSDWEFKYVVGSEISKVLFFPRMEYSTTDIIKRVMDKNTILK